MYGSHAKPKMRFPGKTKEPSLKHTNTHTHTIRPIDLSSILQ